MYKLNLQILVPNIILEMLERSDIHTRSVSINQAYQYGYIIINDMKRRGLEADIFYTSTVDFVRFMQSNSLYIKFISNYYSDAAYGMYFLPEDTENNATSITDMIRDLRTLYRNKLSSELLQSFTCDEAIRYLKSIDNSDIEQMISINYHKCNNCNLIAIGYTIHSCPLCGYEYMDGLGYGQYSFPRKDGYVY